MKTSEISAFKLATSVRLSTDNNNSRPCCAVIPCDGNKLCNKPPARNWIQSSNRSSKNKVMSLGDEICVSQYTDRFVTVALGHQTPSHSGTAV